MDPKLLDFYNQELRFLRETSEEFAKEYPKIAARLGLSDYGCADPYVERLLEGVSYLTARVQLKLDAQYPALAEQLLEIIFPHYLRPLPSIGMVKMDADREQGEANGYLVPRNTVLVAQRGKGEVTPGTFRTTREVRIWHLEVRSAGYFTTATELRNAGDLPRNWKGVKGGFVIKLATTDGKKFSELPSPMESLVFHLIGSEGVAARLYEQLTAHSFDLGIRGGDPKLTTWLGREALEAAGFDEDCPLLPRNSRSYQGYALLTEYFAAPEAFLFVRVKGVKDVVANLDSGEFELVIPVSSVDERLIEQVEAKNFLLGCTPVINLFEKRLDRVHVTPENEEYHLVPERNHPLDYEIYSIDKVVGHGTVRDDQTELRPFYALRDIGVGASENAYYTIRRERRVLMEEKRKRFQRDRYDGSELFMSIVDSVGGRAEVHFKQLEVNALCTNREIPMKIPVGKAATDLQPEGGHPIQTIKFLGEPSIPKPSLTYRQGETLWRVIGHLSLNYLSLADDEKGAAAFRQLLSLYGDIAARDVKGDFNSRTVKKQVEGVRRISSRAETRRLPVEGPVTFGRGLLVEIEIDEHAFEGSGVYLFGEVISRFLAEYAWINSFIEFRVVDSAKREIMRWNPRLGVQKEL